MSQLLSNPTSGNPELTAPEVLSEPYQAGRATIIYNDPGNVDESLDDDLLSEGEPELVDVNNLQADDADLDALADGLLDDETEEDSEFVEGSPRFEAFKSDFNKAFGIELADAVELVQGLQNDKITRAVNEQKYELGAHWEIPVSQVEQRLAVVAKLWNKLPAERRADFDNPKGAITLWAKYEASQGKRAGGIVKSQGKGTVQSSTKYTFTESQINAMDQSTYDKNSAAILNAYATGRVKKSK